MKKKNNLKRFIAGLMSSAMVMASFVFPVETVKADDTINMNPDSLSLTIYKYQTQNTVSGTPGKGVELTGDALPASPTYEPLEGVTFTVYKVADIVQETSGGVTEIKYKTVSGLTSSDFGSEISGELAPATIKSYYEAIDWENVEGVFSKTGTTDGNGYVKFSSSDLSGVGLYLVAETGVPDKVTSPVNPFLVSLPTAIDTTADNTTDVEWIYDVFAYPKNSTMAKSITVSKLGKIGDSTATALSGATFMLQKETAEDTWTPQTTDTDGEKFEDDNGESENGHLTTGNAGTVTFTNLSPGTYRIIEVSAPNDYIAESDIAHRFIITAEGDVKVGEEGQETPSNNITITNVQPNISKTVLVKDTDTYADFADYSTGSDIIKFKVEVDIPSNIAKLNTFTIEDTYVEDLFTDVGEFNYSFIKSDSSPKTMTLTSTSSMITSKTGWKLEINETDRTALSDVAKMVIIFEAKLSDVANKAVTAGAGNLNTVSLEYTNHVYSSTTIEDPDPSTDETSTITDTAKVYTFDLNINKIFEGSDTDTKKATFTLYKIDANGTKTINGNKVSPVLSDIVVTEGTTRTINTTNDGIGLSNGTYYLEETDTEDEYNLLKEPIELVINATYDETYVDDDYQITTISVENKKGFSFPITGGRGTIIFTITGLTLMIVGVCIFFTSRKRKTN